MKTMRTYIYFAFFAHVINASAIWYYPNQLSADWTGITYDVIPVDSVCPGSTNNACWDINTLGSIERIVDTIGYTDVTLTWSMSTGTDLNGAGKSCDIDYWNGIDYTNIHTITAKNTDQTGIYNMWTVDDTTDLRIRLSNTAGGYSCYFNDLRLWGTTAAPTKNPSSSPTTSDPTTATPTASPTTSSPTSGPTKFPSESPTAPSSSPTAAPTSITTDPTETPSSNPTQTPTEIWSDDFSSDALWTGTHSGLTGGTLRFNGGDNVYRTTDVSDFYFIYVVSSITKWGLTLEPGELIHLQYQIDGLLTGWIDVETFDVNQLDISNHRTYLPVDADFNGGLRFEERV